MIEEQKTQTRALSRATLRRIRTMIQVQDSTRIKTSM